MAEAVLIELGEVREEPVVGPPPLSPRLRRTAAVAFAVVLAGLAGGAAPAPVAFTAVSVPAEPNDHVVVREDRMYVVGPDSDRSGVADRTLTAYGLPGGERLWRAALPLTAPRSDLYRADGGALVVIGYDETSGTEMVVFDDNSGALWWRRSAYFSGLAPGLPGGAPRILLTVPTDPDPTTIGWPSRYEAVDPRTGVPAWSYEPPQGADAWPVWRTDADVSTRLITTLPSGRVEVRDLATGEVVAAAGVRPPGPVLSDDDQGPPASGLIADGDLVVVVTGAPGGRSMTAYGLERLDRRWTVPWNHGSQDGFGGFSCGDLMCVVGFDGELRAVERATGRIRWQAPWLWMQQWGSMLLAGDQRGLAAAQRLVLVDPATGRTQRDLGRWDRLGGWPIAEVVVRYDAGARRAWIGLLDQTVPDVQLLGGVDGVQEGCQAGRDSVVCRRLDGSIGIWRYG